MNKFFLFFLMGTVLSGCQALNLENIRETRLNNESNELRQKIATQRSAKIKPTDTSFSEAISCLANPLTRWRVFEKDNDNANKVNYELIEKINELNQSLNTNFQRKQSDINELRQKILPLEQNKLERLSLEKRLLEHKIAQGKLTEQEKQKYLQTNKSINAVSLNISLINEIVNLSELKDIVTYINDVDYSDILTISVAPIYDKTEKVFPRDSTALSEIVTHALSYNSAVTVRDTPLNSIDATISRTKLDLGRLGQVSIGSMLPSDYFINGALVQYDEGDVKKVNDSLSINLRALQFNRNIQVITVGLILRLVDSDKGIISHNKYLHKVDDETYTFVPEKFKALTKLPPQSVYLENTFFVERLQGGLTRIINSKYYGIEGSVTVADPKMYAVREMVEKGVYELLEGLLPRYRDTNPPVELGFAKHQCHQYLPKDNF